MRTPRMLSPILALLFVAAGAAIASAADRYSAELTGVGGSPASGNATFEMEKGGAALHYKLTVSNLADVTMAHIHIAPPGKEGPPAVWLFPSGPPPTLKEGNFVGKLAEGDIKAENLIGDLKGKPLSALVEKFDGGEAYVNVHTKGKPGGEIRGQIHK